MWAWTRSLSSVFALNFKTYWKLLLIFFVVTFCITASMFILPLSSGVIVPGNGMYGAGGYIAPTDVSYEIPQGPGGGMQSLPHSFFLSNVVFSFPTIFLLSIFSLTFINLIIGSEVNNRVLYNWLALPISRTQLFLGKYFTIIIYSLILGFGVILPTWMLLGFSNDIGKYFGILVMHSFNYLFFYMCLTVFYCVLITLFVNKQMAINMFIGVLIFATVGMYLIDVLNKTEIINYPKLMKFINHAAVYHLIYDPWKFTNTETSKNVTVVTKTLSDGVIVKITSGNLLKMNKVKASVFPVVLVIGTIGFTALGSFILKERNYYV